MKESGHLGECMQEPGPGSSHYRDAPPSRASQRTTFLGVRAVIVKEENH